MIPFFQFGALLDYKLTRFGNGRKLRGEKRLCQFFKFRIGGSINTRPVSPK